MQQIKNIIFDLGGVLLTLDYTKTEEAFVKLGAHDFHGLYSQQHASGLFQLLETGNITPTEFFTELRLQGGFQASDEEMTNAWRAMLGHFPKERIQWLKEISNKYRVYLFSNTNEIHYDFLMQKFSNEFEGASFNSLFIKAYYSHFLHLRKPDTESYLKILEEQNLAPAETLFIDDTLANIEGAQKVGMPTIHLQAPQTLLDLKL